MKTLSLLLLLAVQGGIAQNKAQKFYITGLAHTATANDCTIPPIVAYGKDRVDALLHCCEGGGLTVWSAKEYEAFQKNTGKEFEASCKTVRDAKPSNVSSDKPTVFNGMGRSYVMRFGTPQESGATTIMPHEYGIKIDPLPAQPLVEKAVKEKRKELLHAKGLGYGCGFDWCVPEKDVYETNTYDSCSDKRRVLLTSESGEKMCILFPKEK